MARGRHIADSDTSPTLIGGIWVGAVDHIDVVQGELSQAKLDIDSLVDIDVWIIDMLVQHQMFPV